MTYQFQTTINGVSMGYSEIDNEHYVIKYSLEDCTVGMSRAAIKTALRKGKRGDPRKCHLSVAVMADKTNGVIETAFLTTHTYLRYASDPQVWKKFRNSAATQRFIQGFDRGNEPLASADGFVYVELHAVPPSEQPDRTGDSGSQSKKRKPPQKTTRLSRVQAAAKFSEKAR